ncbi:hypothetical protein YGS_C2P0280 [Sphingobium sp. YG1]|nr:hypothetical protein YGS_C2P0280 [Sphingobium sp. YG1]
MLISSLTAALATPVAARQREARVTFDIPAGPLQAALVAYAEQADIQLLFSPDMVAGRQGPSTRGNFSVEGALARLLTGTDITIRRVSAKVIILNRPAADDADRPDGPGQASAGDGVGTYKVAEEQKIASRDERATSHPSPSSDIVVTGSHIRGDTHGPSPVTRMSRRDMDRNGYATVAQALQALPGNFGGMATEQSALARADSSASNSTLATGVNLRGLGADATLVLVNGRRLAGSGSMGAFADISGIPTGAVERVEILHDGASALYGADAVGGVVNIILKDSFEGAESRARFGTVTKGGAQSVQLDQTLGTRWGSGGAMLSYSFDRRTRLKSAARAFARSADSRPLGGTDHRSYFSLPGNILGFDAATGSYGPAFAIPGGRDGTSLTPSDFLPGAVNLEDTRHDTDLIPAQTLHSVYATLDQDIAPGARVALEGRYSRRRFDSLSSGASTILQITPANPWFVSSTGAGSDLIAYSFARELGGTRISGEAEAMALTASADIELGGNWKLSTYGAFGQERNRNLQGTVNSHHLDEALGNLPDDPDTAYNAATEGYFNPYGGGSSNAAAMLAFIGSGYIDDRSRSRIWTGNVQADGPLIDVPGGAIRLALGGNFRRENFQAGTGADYSYTATPLPDTPVSYGRSIGAGFAELHVPIFGSGNARAGFQSLDFSIAARVEHYGDFGTTTNPKFGLRWVPTDGLALRATYGTSFRAPNLRQTNARVQGGTTLLRRADGTQTAVVQIAGGNRDLRPERAKSWTIGADISPKAVPGLEIGTTLFRTIFDRRISLPVFSDFQNALINPDLAPFVRMVSPATDPADLAYVSELLAGLGSAFPPVAVGAVVDARYVNTGETDVSGLDLSARYAVERGDDRFDVSLTASYLFRFRERQTPTATSVDQRNIVGKPVDLRGRFAVGWSHGPFDTLIAANYVERYHDRVGNRISAWTTFDLQLAWKPKGDRGWLSGTTIALVAQNLFDRDPPFYDSSAGLGYDAANASAQGRFVSLQLTRRW